MRFARGVGTASRPISRLPRPVIKHSYLLFRDHLVELQRLRLEVALGDVSLLEMMIGVLAANQRRPVTLTHGLLEVRRDIADRKPMRRSSDRFGSEPWNSST